MNTLRQTISAYDTRGAQSISTDPIQSSKQMQTSLNEIVDKFWTVVEGVYQFVTENFHCFRNSKALL